MAISFNNIPAATRTVNAYAEIDNSRAVKSLVSVPKKALIIGQKISTGTQPVETLIAVTRDNLADGYFGAGSILARMVNKFKNANPNMEVYAVAMSINGGVAASGRITFSALLSVTGDCTFNLMLGGVGIPVTLLSGYSNPDICSAIETLVDSPTYSNLPFKASWASAAATSNIIVFSAVCSGTLGNYLDIRANFNTGESNPLGYSTAAIIYSQPEGGAIEPDLANLWTVIDDQQFDYLVSPYAHTSAILSIDEEFEDRFGPMINLQGYCFTAYDGAAASCTTHGNSCNSPFITMLGVYNSPTPVDEWAAVVGAVVGGALESDPARPTHMLRLPGIIAPAPTDRFTRSERNTLLYDGVATYIVDSGGNVLTERMITTYQLNALGSPDPSYLDCETLATLYEIRYQFLTRMQSRFIIPRFKLAGDSFPVQPGQKVATPKTIKQEIISLFTTLRDIGLIEELENFKNNLVVEINASDPNRVDVLLQPDLINQFRMLAAKIEFIL